MKQKIISTLAVLSSIALLACLVPAAQATTCSTATVAGDWAVTLSGTLILPSGPVPAAATARGTADLDGNLTGTEARNVGGDYADETVSGKWTVNPDCTGSLTLNAYQSGQLVRTSVLSIVFDEHSKEIRMVQKSLTLPDGTQLPVVATVDGKKTIDDDTKVFEGAAFSRHGECHPRRECSPSDLQSITRWTKRRYL
jgi:hypothetical protein